MGLRELGFARKEPAVKVELCVPGPQSRCNRKGATRRLCSIIAIALTVAACRGETGIGDTATGDMIQLAAGRKLKTVPAPQPSAPAPPPPTSPAVGDGKIVVVTEGDSIAVTWGGNHTGMYQSSRPDVEFYGLAVGGSGLNDLTNRIDSLLIKKPDLVSIHIGANDLASFPSAQAYADALKVYVDRIRATGAKVVVTTVLPQQLGTPSVWHNAMRKELAVIVKAANWIDGVADFGADVEMGPDSAPLNKALYSDVLHPTDSTQGVGEGGQVKLFRVFKPAMDKLAFDVR